MGSSGGAELRLGWYPSRGPSDRTVADDRAQRIARSGQPSSPTRCSGDGAHSPGGWRTETQNGKGPDVARSVEPTGGAVHARRSGIALALVEQEYAALGAGIEATGASGERTHGRSAAEGSGLQFAGQ